MTEIKIEFETEKAKLFFKEIIDGVDSIKNLSLDFQTALSAIVFADVISHFEQQKGPNGRWTPWSKVYAERMAAKGKSTNKLLQDTGRMRNSFLPTNVRKQRDGLLWFNNARTKKGFPYAKAHDEGGPKLPQREFMYLSDMAMEKIAAIALKFAEGK